MCKSISQFKQYALNIFFLLFIGWPKVRQKMCRGHNYRACCLWGLHARLHDTRNALTHTRGSSRFRVATTRWLQHAFIFFVCYFCAALSKIVTDGTVVSSEQHHNLTLKPEWNVRYIKESVRTHYKYTAMCINTNMI